MLSLSAKSYSVTVDAAQQKIFFVPRRSLFVITAPRVLSFDEIEQVHLSFSEQNYDIPDEYGSIQRVKRRWSIELALKDGQTVTAAEETTDHRHRVGETSVLSQQRVRWESLAKSFGEVLGKPLAFDPAIPGGPQTFIQAIEYILQRRIRQSGRKNLAVHLCNGRDLGIEIVVNGKKHTAVNDIEEESIRGLIQASIHEWQDGDK